VLAIFVELAQNIIRHGVEAGGAEAGGKQAGGKQAGGILRVTLRHDRLDFFAGNYLAAPAADRFRRHLALFDQQEKSDWRALWQVQLQEPLCPGQKGAGLGLLELARRTGTMPEWRMTDSADGRAIIFVTARLCVQKRGCNV